MASDADPGSNSFFATEVVVVEDNDHVADVGAPGRGEAEGEGGCYLETGNLVLALQDCEAAF